MSAYRIIPTRADTFAVYQGDRLAIICDFRAEAEALIAKWEAASTREIAGNSFIGRRTRKGIVVREMHQGEAIAQWFVPAGRAPLRMPFGGGPFEPCMTEAEAERVAFFARRLAD